MFQPFLSFNMFKVTNLFRARAKVRNISLVKLKGYEHIEEHALRFQPFLGASSMATDIFFNTKHVRASSKETNITQITL